jgi:ATP-dependent DNA helicase DinG
MSYIDDVFGHDGLLAKKFSGYSPRAGQVAMARAVDHALETGTQLLSEAATGTGKSVAYCVPAIQYAAKHNTRVVIVTANIALQEQLVNKDLPLLKEILPYDFRYSLLKGRNNYLCLNKKKELVELKKKKPESLSYEEDKVLEWAEGTITGDISELPFQPEPYIWRKFAVSSDECLDDACEFSSKSCCSDMARANANQAHVVVTNYHMLFAHFAVFEETHKELVLPPFNIAILDEGHKAVDIARDFFGWEINEGVIRWAARNLDSKGSAFSAIHHEMTKFFDNLNHHKKLGDYKARFKKQHPVPWIDFSNALDLGIGEYAKRIKFLEDESGSLLPGVDKEHRKMEKSKRRLSEIKKNVSDAMNLVDDNMVYCIDEEDKKPVLKGLPISVADRMKRHLFSQGKITVVTSATLSANGSFEYIANDLGARDANTIVAESPFRWGDQVLLITPTNIPDPNDPQFTQVAAQTCAEVIKQANGRTLGLFTSYRGLNAAHTAALKTGYKILRQGDMPRTKLIEEFRKDIHSVLLGTESFWAGVDVQGESLSCVFIDRLPFATPDDPIIDVLRERDARGFFTKYSLPQAIIAFKQGFGRLIRTTTDRGVVVVLDKRISTSNYGSRFIEALPPVARSTSVEHVGMFLNSQVPTISVPVISNQPRSLSLCG